MDKPISEMNNKELFCALTGEYGVVKQAYVQNVFRKYKALHGEYGELTDHKLSSTVTLYASWYENE